MASDRQKYIRNFCIIAHIDHGKSTLADRLIEKTGVLSLREMEEQVLDNMDLERERGITIKLQSVKLNYTAEDGNEYILNLIDTPGHVDFTYEVSRSLAACEGAILVIDATQGIEAQTLANVYLALDNNLELYPIINKIDLPSANPELVKKEVEDVIGLDASYAALVSAKEGIGIAEVLEGVVKYIPAPKGDEDKPLKALIFDSYYDSYKGVIAIIRVIDGELKPGTRMRMMKAGAEYDVVEVGTFRPGVMVANVSLKAGDVGYVAASIKIIKDIHVGDTITDANNPCTEALPGYRKVTPMVYCGIYPADGADYNNVRDALEKLQLNDAAMLLNLKPPQLLALVSAVASWDFCTWK